MVKASGGHVMDLPKKKLGVDIENNFEPEYAIIARPAILKEIKKLSKEAEKIYLASDPDREGEAIAWHIAQIVGKGDDKRICRVLFNEITERAIKEAIANPLEIDFSKVNAQQARRVLDRIVGYKISPLLWEKVRRGLSAGRVQSVAVRLICEREREIQAFVPVEFWSITAQLEGKNPPPFEARLFKVNDKKAEIKNEEEAKKIISEVEKGDFVVTSIEKKERRRYPSPPFITSTLQQEAAKKLYFTAKRTMMIAQRLYEGMELGEKGPVGLITYMRTDSVRIAPEALKEARGYINSNYGNDYLPEKPAVYKSRKGAQEAHEAVRPTSIDNDPESIKKYLGKDEYNLYKLIWNRFIASQMNPAVYDQTTVDIKIKDYLFRATGSVIKFPGFIRVYTETEENGEEKKEETPSDEEKLLPQLAEGERLKRHSIDPKQHFTQPPPRYSEALLIKELEENGIGRPSTYANILSTIQERKYVEKKEGRFHPTELGFLINDLLVKYFPNVLNVEFTAKLEEELDEIEGGQKEWTEAVRDFYNPFNEELVIAQKEMRNIKKEEIPTDIVCEKCGKKMVIKWGRHGQFLACSGYPECKSTKEFTKNSAGTIEVADEEKTSEVCENCGSPMVVKRGRFGKFLACSKYPECKTVKSIVKTTGVKCPEKGCEGEILERKTKRGKAFYGCSKYPNCKYALWDKPINRPCPQCGAAFVVEKYTKAGTSVKCIIAGCNYKEEVA
ncbi:MAG: type I DNA topoisomerase [Nitrospirae bacterium]|nr:type I DNA topoisomerase [Nitrospirota bacterium]